MTPTAAAHARPLLIELQTEELPPRALRALGSAFQQAVQSQLATRGLLAQAQSSPSAAAPSAAAPAPLTLLCTPRRLVASLPAVRAQADPRREERKGPSLAVGLDAQGQPTMALLKWAEKQGAGIDELERFDDGRQGVFRLVRQVPGAVLRECIGEVLQRALSSLPVPKRMSYQLADGLQTVEFIRPAHHLIVLHGDEVLPCTALGLEAGRITSGHRFQGADTLRIADADAARYARQLQDEGRVIVGFDERRGFIEAGLRAEAGRLGAVLSAGGDGDADPVVQALLDEVTALVENPAVYVGQFDREFLVVPPECLILTMRTNQKYFPLFDAQGSLTEKFLIVSNLVVDDPRAIVDGNERVVRPRLADARFFYEQDRRTPLAERAQGLASVVYHQKLGTQADRVERLRSIGSSLAAAVGADATQLDRALQLAKADLLSAMVGEFPELQGIMGRYYAQADGEAPAVAEAIAEHYRPRFAGDALPAGNVGLAAALADKLETLAGIWGAGQRPTGDRDPFALRRHALGVARIVVERNLPVSLREMLGIAFDAFSTLPAPARGGARAAFEADVEGLGQFVVDRLRSLLRDRGFESADIDAVLAVESDRLQEVEPRVRALAAFRSSADHAALAAAAKRIGNILRKRESAVAAPAQDGDVNPALLLEPAEQALHARVQALQPQVEAAFAQREHAHALSALAALREPVDRFFDEVMVNAEDAALRDNRLNLLARLHGLMNQVADLGR